MSDYYDPTGSPSTGSAAASAVIRAEFAAVQAAFAKLPSLSVGALPLFVNVGCTALEAANIATAQARLGIVSSNELNGIANLNSVGIIARTGNGAYAARTLNGTASQINVANGNGSLGNPTLSLPSPLVTPGNVTVTGVMNATTGAAMGSGGWPSTDIGQTEGRSGTLAAVGDAYHIILNRQNNVAVDQGGHVYLGARKTNGANDVAFVEIIGARENATSGNDATYLSVLIQGLEKLHLSSAGKLTGTSSMLSPLNNSLAADVNLNNTSLFFDGPSVAQGNNGTWFASGRVTVRDIAGGGIFQAKLWDGATVIDAFDIITAAAGQDLPMPLSGFITSPSGNIRISVRDSSTTTGVMKFNAAGLSRDSTITAIRIG